MTEDKSIEKIKVIETSARRIMEKGLPTLPYYNDSNYSKNSKTLKRIVLSGDKNLMDYGEFAMYWPSNNTLTVDERILIYDEDSVKLLNSMIDELGEENIYRGFFEADVKLHTKGFNDEQKSRWLDYFAKFHLSEEEKNIKKSIKSIYDNNKDNENTQVEPEDIEQ